MQPLIDSLFSEQTSQLSTAVWTIIGVIWFYGILWTMRDIYSRSESSLFQLFCIILATIGGPLIGVPLYILIRPFTQRDDTIGRQMLMEIESVPCGACMRPNLVGHDHCVFCGGSLKIQCKNCKEMYPHTHQYCYKCGAPNLTWKE